MTRRDMDTNRGTDGAVVSADGTTIAYYRMGRGPALVLVDGAFCYRDNGPMPDVAAHMAAHFTVFGYDRRGRGASGNAAPYAVAREIEDLRAVVDEAGGSAFVFGMSSGAALALQAAASGVRIRALALYEPPYLTPADRPQSIAEMRRHLERLVRDDDRAGAVRYFLTACLGAPKAFALLMPLLMPRAWRRNKSVAHTLPYDLAILEDWTILGERAPLVTMSTLVIAGANSPADLRQASEAVVDALPNAELTMMPGQTHHLRGQAVAPVLTRHFLSAS
jgi:hypothetical protein